MIYDYRCKKCGNVQSESRLMANRDVCPRCDKCGNKTSRSMSVPVLQIPEWMSDKNISARSKQREWLKTPEAKKMDLSPCRSED